MFSMVSMPFCIPPPLFTTMSRTRTVRKCHVDQFPLANRTDRNHRSRCRWNPQHSEICNQSPVSPLNRGPENFLKLPSGKIKRVILFSSSVSAGLLKVNYEYSEEDWNDDAINDVVKNGEKAIGMVKYMASKTLAERSTIIRARLLSDCLPIQCVRGLGALS